MLKQFDDFDLDIQKTTIDNYGVDPASTPILWPLTITNKNASCTCSHCCPPTGTGCLTLQFGGCDSVNAACIPQNRPSIEQPCR